MKYTTKNIYKLYLGWSEKMNSSWDRGKESLQFVEGGYQDYSNEDRTMSREHLVFNVINKFLKTVQANGKELDLTVSLKANDALLEDKEKKVFQTIVDHIMFENENLNAFRESLDEVYSFGQSVLQVKSVRENQKTLNKILKIETISDPTTAFFDYNAPSKTYHDGRFCGRVYKISRENLTAKYKNLNNSDLPKNLTVIDFWYKKSKKAKYIKLTTGQYKLEKLIDPLRDMIVKGDNKIDGTVNTICYMRVVKEIDKVLTKETLSSSILPMVMNYGGMSWVGTGAYESFPFGYHLRDAQLLLNYAGSTAADILKTTTADKWLFQDEHLLSDDACKNANEISQREGGFNFTGDIRTIRREQSQQLPPSIVSLFEQTRAIMEDLVGSYFESSRSNIKAMSGVALNKMFDRMDLTQSNVVVAHLNSVNVIGEIVRQYIPVYYTETRKITTVNSAGKENVIEINSKVEQPNGMVVVKNSISDLSKNYRFKVNVAPSLKVQSQNIVAELEGLYKIDQRYAELTADLYVKHLNIPNADIISKRLASQIPEELIKYSDGEITKDEYDKIVAEKMEEAKKSDPELLTAIAKMQTEQYKAKTEQYKAETARNKEAMSATTERVKIATKVSEMEYKNENEKAYIELERAKTMLSSIEKRLTPRVNMPNAK